MKMNDRLNGFIWGNASGAVATVIIGLSMGWIVSSGKADVMASERAKAALVAVMTPVCVERFQRAEGYAGNLAALKKIDVSWARRDFVVKGDWANIGEKTNYELANECAETLNRL